MLLRVASFAALLFLCACPAPKPPPVDAGPSPEPLTFSVVFDELPATLLSAWESTDGVLFAVGGTATRSFVLRHDAQGWWEMDPGTDQALWWVYGFSANDVWAVGNQGVVTHFDGTRWRVEKEGADCTLYGIWGSSSANLLAVGGNVQSSRARGVVLSKASGWNEVTTALPSTTPLFKIWGRNSGDYFIVGERGLLAHGGAGGIAAQLSPSSQRFTTVDGNATDVVAVGGSSEAVMARFVDSSWRLVMAPGTPSVLNGVAVSPAGTTLVVGFDGYLAAGRGESFTQLTSPTTQGLHGALATQNGFVAVGGDLLGNFGHGVVLTSSSSLTGGMRRAWPNAGERYDAGTIDAGEDAGLIDAGPIDAGEDAGVEDAGVEDGGREPPDGGWLPPGGSCDGRYQDCAPGLDCWLVFGPFKNYCAAICADVSECGAYGPNACCKVPGPQVMTPVCLPEIACDAGS
ncbi:MAG: hypothetical protein QM817_20010 [Archangium sp.]